TARFPSRLRRKAPLYAMPHRSTKRVRPLRARTTSRSSSCTRQRSPRTTLVAEPRRASLGHAVESQPIVVLGGSEDDRASVVSQLVASGFLATAVTKLTAADGLPALIVIVGDAAVEIVGEAREVPALADTPILVLVPPLPASTLASALAA